MAVSAYQIRLAYEQLWEFVITETRRQARSCNFVVGEQREGFIVSLDQPLVIEAVRTRQQGGEVLDLYLELKQKLALMKGDWSSARIEQSNVSLVYTTRSEDGDTSALEVVQGLHFDYAYASHHPVFHAQYNPRAIREERLGREIKPLHRRYDVPRIPIPPMGFPEAIYMVLHDHFWPNVTANWWKKWRRATDRLPALRCARLEERVIAQQRLDSTQWYSCHIL